MAIPETPYAVRQETLAGALLLDRNEGAIAPPELLSEIAVDGLVREYPTAAALEALLAERIGVAADHVLVTAGADDAIDRCCRLWTGPDRALVYPTPTFEMLERYGMMAGAILRPVQCSRGRFPVDLLRQAVDAQTGMIALVTPNNPTGGVTTEADLDGVLRTCPRVPVMIDHAYVEYADVDLTTCASEFPSVVVVRTLSKAWGLAGCRVGYVVGAADVIRRLRAAGAPYPVAGPSIAVASRWLTHGAAVMAEHVASVRAQRTWLTERLRALGAAPLDSQANFVLAEFGRRAAFVRDGLRSLGVLVRDFTSLDPFDGALRITVTGTPADGVRLDHCLTAVLTPGAVLFDLDGVLADVSCSYRECIVETARSFGVTLTPEAVTAARMAGNATNDWELTRRLMAAAGVEVTLSDITARFQSRYLGADAEPGLRERERALVTAAQLRDLLRGRPCAVVTGRPRAEAEWFLARADLSHLITAVVALEDGPLKPDPAPVRQALRRLGVRTAWMVGDTPDDIRAARAANVVPLGVVAPEDDPATAARALKEAGAVRMLDHLTDLEEYLT